jgi:anthranilate/para-aminobenzoate synthase component I
MAKVARIREEIFRGNVYQVNLTRQERWAFSGNLAEFARRLWSANPAPHSALIADAGWAIVSSSPESFFRISEGRLLTRPIKGTAPRGAMPAEDRHLAEALLASPKNRSELAMIVDLLRNDLSRICAGPSVRVNAFPALESYANVHHLVAEIEGELPGKASLETLLRAVFPGGSITGCPKLAAMGLIRELEPWPRRVYTGALGWCRADLRQGEFAIPIRTAWASGGELRFGVGGGVVWDSEPREEYEETRHKGRSLVQCLS